MKDLLNDELLETLTQMQGKLGIKGKAYDINHVNMGKCPYGCGRACSGCEYSCQNTSSN